MKIEKLLKDLDCEVFNNNIKEINDIEKEVCFCYDCKDVYMFANKAIKKGACLIVCEEYIDVEACVVVVKNARFAKSLVAKNYYQTQNVKVIGITGTNGKTTTSFMIASILKQSGWNVGIIGTNGAFYNNKKIEIGLTTPDSLQLHFLLNKMQKCDFVVMEVSAHAIDQHRTSHISFICKILTNVTQDHLDYFKNMQTYKQAKFSFFDNTCLQIANADDFLSAELKDNANFNFVSTLKNEDFYAFDINKSGTSFKLALQNETFCVDYNFFGLFNVYNALCAAACCCLIGVELSAIKEGLCSAKCAEGRFNVFEFDNKKVIVDFAHTPDGLENVLKCAREITKNKLYCVFGCGGNRDKKKRKIMGAISEKYADFSFITSDNPRFEEPYLIMQEIQKGFCKKNYCLIENRKNAIAAAINLLKDDDCVLICGKGGENYMDIRGEKIEYCDLSFVQECIKSRKTSV